MNLATLILAAFIVLGLVLAIRMMMKRKSSCSGSCSSCTIACSSKNGQSPEWVKKYRQDHPKPVDPSSKET